MFIGMLKISIFVEISIKIIVFFLFFLETSLPQKYNDKARLVSIVQQPSSSRCLEFWYHMFGEHIGKLNIYVNTNTSNNDSRSLLWSHGANIGDVWRKARIPLELTLPYRIIFEGVVGNGINVKLMKTKQHFDYLFFYSSRVILLLMMLQVQMSHVQNRMIAISNKIHSVDGKMRRNSMNSNGKLLKVHQHQTM